jgi:hypothetical protein
VGVVHVLNIEKIRLSTYTITCNDTSVVKHPNKSTYDKTNSSVRAICLFFRAIIDLQLKPTNEEILLIGYESGAIIEWDLRNRKVIHNYMYTTPDTVCNIMNVFIIFITESHLEGSFFY